jgi:hypothetical protein
MSKSLVVIESPYAGDIAGNVAYARRCVRDSIERGEIPFASHLLYTQVGILDDHDPEERALGIALGLEVIRVADYVAVYSDRGISKGMQYGIEAASLAKKHIIFRSIDEEESPNDGDKP